VAVEAADVSEIVLGPKEVLAHPVQVLDIKIFVLSVDTCK
jgi:hypothetical protein